METLRIFLIALAVCSPFGIPVWIGHTTSERAEMVGYSEPHSVFSVNGNNYSVFRKAREVLVITGLIPRRIVERGGEITTIVTIINKLNPVHIYLPANQGEEALWKKHFQS